MKRGTKERGSGSDAPSSYSPSLRGTMRQPEAELVL